MSLLSDGFIQAISLLFSGDAQTWSAVSATVRVSAAGMIISLTAGLPLGFMLGYYEFRGKRPLKTIVDTLLALPTVFIGLMVYAFLTRNGVLGSLGLLFSLPAIAIGQTILALPIIVSLTAAAVENRDEPLSLTLLSLGAAHRQILYTTLWEVRHAILAGIVTAYGRVMTEVGISMMVGGNIKWHTRTITTAIALETNKGEFAQGVSLGIVLLLIAFGVNLSLVLLRRRSRA